MLIIKKKSHLLFYLEGRKILRSKISLYNVIKKKNKIILFKYYQNLILIILNN